MDQTTNPNPVTATVTAGPIDDVPAMPIRLTGVVARLREGWGFFTVDGYPDHFFHKSDLRSGTYFGQLRIGSMVEFTPDIEPKGPAARDILVLS